MKTAWFMALAIGASSMLTACGGGGSGTTLTGGTWYLTSGSETAPAWQWAVPPGEQSKYTIAFASDDTFSATADCNQVAGVYKTSGSDGLSLQPGPSTLAYCGDGSLGDLYVHSLSTTTSYKIANGELTLTRANGTLSFTSKKPTASAAPAASAPEVPQGSPGDQALTGQTWQLTAITEKVPAFQGVVPDDQQAKYTITFADDKSFTAKADCNNVAGAYVTGDPTASSGPLEITPGPSTLAYCGDGSLGDLYVIGLSSAASYAIDGGVLTITTANGGTLQFK
jgi:heat shock protein HslJ